VPGYESVNQVFPLRWVVYFKIMGSNIGYISCTRKPTQPLHYVDKAVSCVCLCLSVHLSVHPSVCTLKRKQHELATSIGRDIVHCSSSMHWPVYCEVGKSKIWVENGWMVWVRVCMLMWLHIFASLIFVLCTVLIIWGICCSNRCRFTNTAKCYIEIWSRTCPVVEISGRAGIWSAKTACQTKSWPVTYISLVRELTYSNDAIWLLSHCLKKTMMKSSEWSACFQEGIQSTVRNF